MHHKLTKTTEHRSYVHVNLLHDKTTPNSQFKSDLLMLLVYFVCGE